MDAKTIQRYVGLKYVPGVFDCADLVMLVQKEVFQREIQLPQDRNRPTHLRAQYREILSWLPQLVVRREGYNVLEDGDGVLLQIGAIPIHIGVLCQLEEPYVLHADNALSGSVLTKWRQLREFGYKVEGVYAWR